MRRVKTEHLDVDATPRADVVEWLLAGDPAIAWQTQRDVLGLPRKTYENTRKHVSVSGWGARLLDMRANDGTWGGGLYSPKWKSTFYTLQLLSVLGVGAEQVAAVASCRHLLDEGLQASGGAGFWRVGAVDTCVTAMLLTMALRFGLRADPRLTRMLSWLLAEQMADGGWNCQSHRRGTTHSSFHTTTSVLEALDGWLSVGRARDATVMHAAQAGREFMLLHHLYRSHRTGAVVRSDFARFSFPHWWKFDVLRGLDGFRSVAAPWDARLVDPVTLVASQRGVDGRWKLPKAHPGTVWFALEKVGQSSRWNTLRALRVLRWAERAAHAPARE